MDLTNDDIQSRNRQLQDDLVGAQTQRANLTALRTASKPIGYSSTGGYGPAAPTYRSPIDRINYETAATGMAQNDATMRDITKRAGALTNDANNFTAQQVAVRYGVRPQLALSGVDPMFATVQHGVVSSHDQPKVAGAPSPATGTVTARKPVSFNPGISREFGGTGQVVKDSLASSVDKNGVPTFDNSSIQRMLDRDGQPAAGGVASSARYASVAPADNGNSRPILQPIGVSIGAAGLGINDRRGRIVSDLDSAIARASMNPNSRSKRELLSQLVVTKQGYINNQDALAAGAEQAALAQKGELQRAMIGQEGEDRRQKSALQTQVDLEGMRQAGENIRVARSNRPYLTIGDKIGTVGDDGVFRAVKSEDGKVMSIPQQVESRIADAGDRLKSIDSERKSLIDGLTNSPNATDAEKLAIRQRLQLLQAQSDQLRGTMKPTPDEFLQHARAVNPGKSDSDLMAYYAKEYGS